MSKPDYVLKVKARDGSYATKIGAAWRTRSGDGINIRLDPGIALVGGEGIDITLWPFEERSERGGGRGGPRDGYGTRGDTRGGGYDQRRGEARDDFGDDEIPF